MRTRAVGAVLLAWLMFEANKASAEMPSSTSPQVVQQHQDGTPRVDQSDVSVAAREAEITQRRLRRDRARARQRGVPSSTLSAGVSVGYGGIGVWDGKIFGESYDGLGPQVRVHGSLARTAESRHALQLVLQYGHMRGKADPGGIFGGGSKARDAGANHVGAQIGWLWRAHRYFRLSLGVGLGMLLVEESRDWAVPEVNLGLTGLLPLGDNVALQLSGEASFAYVSARFGVSGGVVFGL